MKNVVDKICFYLFLFLMTCSCAYAQSIETSKAVSLKDREERNITLLPAAVPALTPEEAETANKEATDLAVKYLNSKKENIPSLKPHAVPVLTPEEAEIANRKAVWAVKKIQLKKELYILWQLIPYLVLILPFFLLLLHGLFVVFFSPQKKKRLYSFEKRGLFYLSSISLFIFGLFIFVPWNIYFGNIVHFSFILKDFMQDSFSESAVLIVGISFVLILIPSVISDYLACIIAGLGLCIYAQSMFMNLFLTEMDGMEPEWNQHLVWGVVNIILWGVIISIPIVLKRFVSSYKFVITAIASAFLVLEIVSAVSLVVDAPETVWRRKSTCYLDGAKQFHLSKKRNIVVFVFDALGKGFLDYCFQDDPEIKKTLKDFTWYTDARSNYAQTFPGLPHELTGANIHPAKNRMEMLSQLWGSASAKSFYQQVKKAGFDSRLYINERNQLGDPDNFSSFFSNIVKDDVSYSVNKKGLLEGLIQMSLFSATPYLGKRYFFYDAETLNKHVKTEFHSKAVYVSIPRKNGDFYQKMVTSGITIDGDSPVLAFYYTTGTHAPWNYNEKCEKVETAFDDPLPTIKSCLFIVSEFIRLLKEKQIYEDTAILICSDHGSHGLKRNSPYDMSFLLKPFNQNNSSIVMDESKVLSIDILPFLLQQACGSQSDFSAFEGFPPSRIPANRERTVRLLTRHPDIPAFLENDDGKTTFQYNSIKEFSFKNAESFMQRDFRPEVQSDGANEMFIQYVPLSSEAVVDKNVLLKPRPWNK